MPAVWATVLLSLTTVLPCQAAEPTARYTVRFEATWSAATHPQSFPGRPHFSRLVGGTHASGVSFWQPGALASPGIERMAELGDPNRLATEIRNATGLSDQVFIGPGIERSPDTASLDFTIQEAFPRVTLVTMIAPSPDWFVGVADLPLLRGGSWVEELVVDLVPWDAGTDSGPTYRSADADTQPAQPISHITHGPLGNGTPYLGRFVFTRTDIEPPPPLLLRDGRFAVETRWRRSDGTAGHGRSQLLTADTGAVWFFSPDNIELIVKVLDACKALHPRFWVFAGGLTNVEVELRVTDLQTGQQRTYSSPLGQAYVPVQDTRAFATCPP